MSSRSFRRRNNRRRHRQGEDAQGERPSGQPADRPLGPGGTQRSGGQRPHGRPGGRGPSGRAPEPQRPAQTQVPLVFPDCPICGKSVRELASALTHRIARQPAHFDCVMREIRDSNEIAPQEKICYLGGGSFGILEFRPPGGPSRFVIRKRIQYEEKEAPQDWKKPLQVPC